MADGIHFQPGCKCLDGKDNDCDGLIDFADPDCPNLAKAWVIQTNVVLDRSKTMLEGVWVISGGTLTINPNIILTIPKRKGLHVEPGGKVDPVSLARIRFI